MSIKTKHYRDFSKNDIDEWADLLLEYFLSSKKTELVFCGIGTDRVIYDSVGCLTGEFCNNYNFNNISVYGTLEYPIHALNIDQKIDSVYENHKDAFIIAVDACLGQHEEHGNVRLRDFPISPGKGVGKVLRSVGNLSIVGVIGRNEDDIFLSNKIRLFDVFNLSLVISKIMKRLDEKLGEDKNDKEL